MQRIWTVVLSVWAMLAIVAVLAWSHRPLAPAAAPTAAAKTLVVQGPNGKRQVVVVQQATAAAPHATTSTSHVAP